MTKPTDLIEIRKIEIEFPCEIGIDPIVFRKIDELITEIVCKPYREAHPDRTMWVSGHGFKATFSHVDAMFLGKQEFDESIPDGEEPRYDDSIYEISITEREKY